MDEDDCGAIGQQYVYLAGIAVGESTTFVTSGAVATYGYGTHSFGYFLDRDCTVAEEDETNNSGIVEVSIVDPDDGKEFNVYRNDEFLANVVVVNGVQSTEYSDSDLMADTQYCYTVTEMMDGEESAASESMCATSWPNAPAGVMDFTAVAGSEDDDTDGATLSWSYVDMSEGMYFQISADLDEAPCPEGQIGDCNGNCAYESWVGDGLCDDGSWSVNGIPIYFNCEQFNNDAGDCDPGNESPVNPHDKYYPEVENPTQTRDYYIIATTTEMSYTHIGNDEGCYKVAVIDGFGQSSEESEEICATYVPDCILGDANISGGVNVSDIVLLINAILQNGGSAEGVECGDMDDNGVINVTDIVAIVQLIVHGMDSNTSSATEAEILIGNDVKIDADGQISAIQMVLSHDSDFSLELTQNAWVADYATNDNKTTLIVVMPNSEYLFTPKGEFTIEESIVLGLEDEIDVNINIIPVEFSVSNAYPNPFNPVTALNINLPEDNLVKVNVYNVTGQLIDAVFSNNLTAGSHSITWDAGNLTSGVYLIRTEAGKNISTQKVMLLK